MTDGELPIVVLGEAALVEGYALAGARVVAAEDPDAVRHAWSSLPDEVVFVLTPAAARAVVGDGDELRRPLEGSRLWVVMPE